MEGLLKSLKCINICCQGYIFFQNSSIYLFLFFSFPFSLFLFNIWWTMFPSPVPAEGNKELRCWSNGLFVTLMKYYSQLYHPLATRCWQGPRSHPEALSWPITSLNKLLLLPSRGCTSPASCPGGQAAHQSLGCAALSAHVSPGKVRKTCRKRNAGRKDWSVLIQNIIPCFEGSLLLFFPPPLMQLLEYQAFRNLESINQFCFGGTETLI